MFTGIIGGVGVVRAAGEGFLEIEAPSFALDEPIALGESVAVNGACLTAIEPGRLRFDVAPETLRRTNLGSLRAGDRVNLERAMRPTDRFGGHLVQGHVDGVGRVAWRREEGNATVLRFAGPEEGARYLVERGSVAVDGVSLTVARPQGGDFEAWIIPHSLAATTLGERKEGDPVNIEFDEVAKWVERLAAPHRA